MEQLYIIGSKYSGKKTIKRILSIVDNNDNNTCFRSKMWDITCIDIYDKSTLITALNYLSNYIQKNVVFVIDAINYEKDLHKLFHLINICCKMNIFITFCVNKIDLLLYDYCDIQRINNIINSYIHDMCISYCLYKIVNISCIKNNKNIYFNIFSGVDELSLCEALIYSSFYSYKKRNYDSVYRIKIDDTIKVVINENYNKIICLVNNYEYEAKLELIYEFILSDKSGVNCRDLLSDFNQKNKQIEYLVVDHFINIDTNNPIVVVYL